MSRDRPVKSFEPVLYFGTLFEKNLKSRKLGQRVFTLFYMLQKSFRLQLETDETPRNNFYWP